MARRRGNPFRTSRLNWREVAGWLAAALCAALGCVVSANLSAQQTSVAVVGRGDAAVTGFSGASPPAQIAPGDDPGRSRECGFENRDEAEHDHGNGPSSAHAASG